MTIIPTYDTDVLGYWVAENEELLPELKIDLAPSASRCTINLQVRENSILLLGSHCQLYFKTSVCTN